MSDEKPARVFTFYQDEAEKWRWRCKSRNNKTVAISGECFFNKSTAIRAAKQEAAFYGAAAIVQEEPRKPKNRSKA